MSGLSFTVPEEQELATWTRLVFELNSVPIEARQEFVGRVRAFKAAYRNAVIEECKNLIVETARQRSDDHGSMIIARILLNLSDVKNVDELLQTPNSPESSE